MIANFTHNVPFRPFHAISLFKQQIANDLSDSQQFFWSFFSTDSLQKWFWLHIQFSLLLFFSIYFSETKRNRMRKYDIWMAKIAQITLRIRHITSHYIIYGSAFDCGTMSFFVVGLLCFAHPLINAQKLSLISTNVKRKSSHISVSVWLVNALLSKDPLYWVNVFECLIFSSSSPRDHIRMLCVRIRYVACSKVGSGSLSFCHVMWRVVSNN